jgi:tetratricopeptide (TPR) repeat protein
MRALPAIIILASALAATASDAAAPGGVQGGESSGSAAIPVLCERSFVYSPSRKRCLRAKGGAISDEELYTQGRLLALAGHHQNALDALIAVRNGEDARVLTMLGYSKRKLGRIEEGIADYKKALVIDPNNAAAREYLGEAYVETGRPDLARLELEKIEAICGGRTCDQYADLAEALAGAPKP